MLWTFKQMCAKSTWVCGSRVNGVHAVVNLLCPSQTRCSYLGLKGDLYDLLFVSQSLGTAPSWVKTCWVCFVTFSVWRNCGLGVPQWPFLHSGSPVLGWPLCTLRAGPSRVWAEQNQEPADPSASGNPSSTTEGSLIYFQINHRALISWESRSVLSSCWGCL